jgi:hypothetical protein
MYVWAKIGLSGIGLRGLYLELMIKEYLEQSKQIYLVIAFYTISNFITMKFMSSSGKFNKP